MFSLSWFTTIPGILITVGVLLLIIALVIFIVTNKKGKKEKGGNAVAPASVAASGNVPPAPAPSIVTTNQPPVDTSMNTYGQSSNVMGASTGNGLGTTPVMPTPMDIPTPSPYATPAPTTVNSEVQPQGNDHLTVPTTDMSMTSVYQNSSIPSASSVPSVEVNPTPTITTLDANSGVDNLVNMPNSNASVESVQAEPVINMNIPSTMEGPSMGENSTATPTYSLDNSTLSMQPEVPTITSSINATEELQSTVPSVTPTVEQVLPEMQSPQIPDLNVTSAPVVSVPNEVVSTAVNDAPIYGGVSTIIPDASPEVPHQIYGGANPLESTQQVPISQIANGINNGGSVNTPTQEVVHPEVSTPITNLQQMSNTSLGSYQASSNVASGVGMPTTVSNTSYAQMGTPTQTSMVQQAPVTNGMPYQGMSNPSPQVTSVNQSVQ